MPRSAPSPRKAPRGLGLLVAGIAAAGGVLAYLVLGGHDLLAVGAAPQVRIDAPPVVATRDRVADDDLPAPASR